MAAIAEQLDAGGGAPSALFAKLRKARAAEAQQRYVDANLRRGSGDELEHGPYRYQI